MDCREFHKTHSAFIDDTLSGIELVGVQRHIAECEECAKHDAIVRRSLLLFRNLPRIEPSPDFSERLNIRIRELKNAEAAPVFHHSRVFAATIAVSSALMLGYIGGSLRDVDTSRDIVLPPVVASIPEHEHVPIMTLETALMAAVPARLPVCITQLTACAETVH